MYLLLALLTKSSQQTFYKKIKGKLLFLKYSILNVRIHNKVQRKKAKSMWRVKWTTADVVAPKVHLNISG